LPRIPHGLLSCLCLLSSSLRHSQHEDGCRILNFVQTFDIDDWFRSIRQKYADQMQCGRGCTLCCYGLFDISLADAREVARGFQKLSPELQNVVRAKASQLHLEMIATRAASSMPTLFSEDDPKIDVTVSAANNPACPCLGDAGECLIYEHRPLSCRLEGVPMVDIKDGLFGDWCELNFEEGIPEAAEVDLKQDYDAIAELDYAGSAAVAERAGIADSKAVTFIASVIAEFEGFWKALLPVVNPRRRG
jgi:Fe-S-cluster containining protein